MSNSIYQRTRVAGAAIERNRIVMRGANDGTVVRANAATVRLLGISDNFDILEAGLPVDVQLHGPGWLTLGSAVTQGDHLTADSQGRGVPANPAAGTRNFTVGQALESGLAGDRIQVFVQPGTVG